MTGERDGHFDHLPLSRYDLVLAAIPSVFVVAVLVGNLLSLPPTTAVAGAALAAGVALVDALFVNPPVDAG
jgi:hypothetical protein